MADTTRSLKPLWWGLGLVAFLALCVWAYVGTKRSNDAVQQAAATGSGVGLAYDPATGTTTPAGAEPGAFGTGGPGASVSATANPAGGSAGGTIASINSQVQAAPVPVAQVDR